MWVSCSIALHVLHRGNKMGQRPSPGKGSGTHVTIVRGQV